MLGEEVAGVYAAGSVAVDAFQPGRSDINVAVVCRSGLPALSKDQLVQRLRHGLPAGWSWSPTGGRWRCPERPSRVSNSSSTRERAWTSASP